MSLSSAKAKLDAQGGDPATGYISKQDHKDSYDQLVDDTALTGATTAEALAVTGALTAGTIASDATVAGTGLAGGLLSSANPVINGVAAPGTSAIPSRQDHVHAIDTTRAPLASPTFTGTVTIPSGLVLGTVTHTEGTGSPQSVVTAPVGSTYIDTAATTGAIKWLKASGTGNTGWVVQHGDTGRRDIASLANSIGTLTLSSLVLRRIGSLVSLEVSWADSQTNPNSVALVTLPAEFRPSGPHYFTTPYDSSSSTAVRNLRVSAVSGTVYYGGATNASGFVANMTWATSSTAWPSSLPGSAA